MDGRMKEDGWGDATASQHSPVAVSQCLLMINSCRVDEERKKWARRGEERHTHCFLLSSHQLRPAMFQSALQSDNNLFLWVLWRKEHYSSNSSLTPLWIHSLSVVFNGWWWISFRHPFITTMSKGHMNRSGVFALFWGLVLRFSGFSQQRVDRLRMAVAAMWAASASWE